MSRIRTIKPEFWTSEQVVECSPTARLLFIGFWNFADDNGVLPASAKHIKMLVYPGDDFTVAQVQGFIDELLHQGLLAGFTAEDGRAYWYVTGWSRHQKIDKPSNKYPAPPPVQDSREKIQQPVVEYSTNPRRTFDESSVTERSVEEGKGKEGKGRGVEEEARTPTHPSQPVLPVAEATPVEAAAVEASGQGQEDFEAFWATYPKRAGGNPRTTALKAWNARCKDGHKASVIIDGARRYAAYCQATGKLDSEYVKQASTFLNQLSFLDPWNLPTPQPHNGQPRQFLNKQDRIAAQNEAAIAEWLASRRHETHVLEGECHEIH